MPDQTPSTASHDTPVLIVGAGPTGPVLALSLQRQGVRFRVISNAAGPGEQTRAMGVHARTLEFYRQFGIADAVVAAGVKATTIHLREARANGDGFEVCEHLGVALDVMPWTDGAHKAGLRQDGVYLIRPDGYVGLASHSDSTTALRAYTTRLGLDFGQNISGAIGVA
jgi:2-polyprenyl-6-methoxyphenol hydroxylase-like FAD-dependent oxidoreductase